MDFTFDEAQLDLASLTRDIVAGTVDAAHHARLDALPHRIDAPLMSALVDADVWGASLPSEHGGSGLGPLHDCSIAVELGRGIAAVPFTTSSALCASFLVRYAPGRTIRSLGIDAGKGRCMLAPAIDEDVMEASDRPSLTATTTSDGVVLTGTKVAVPFGAVADAFLVTASTADGDRIVVVPASAPGVHVTPVVTTGGDCTAVLRLDDVLVAAESVLHGPAGTDLVALLRERATILICATQLGILERSLELVAEYASVRTQFGRPIGSFQAVGQRLADAYIDVAAVRSTMWRAAWTSDTTPDDGDRSDVRVAVATAKFWAADAGHRVAHTLVHVHGGVGIDTSHIAHRYFLAAKNGEFTLGHATASLLDLGCELVGGSPG